MNPISKLKDDHKRVRGLFKRFATARNKAGMQKIAEKIFEELEVHTKLEENDFYPAVEATGERGTDFIREAEQEHAVVENLIGELRGMAPESEQYEPTFKVLKENVEHHVKEEEEEMFPYAKRALGTGELNQLGRQMAASKRRLAGPGMLESALKQAKKLVSEAVEAVSETVGVSGKRRRRPAAKTTASTTSARRRKSARGQAATAPARKRKVVRGSKVKMVGSRTKARSRARSRKAG